MTAAESLRPLLFGRCRPSLALNVGVWTEADLPPLPDGQARILLEDVGEQVREDPANLAEQVVRNKPWTFADQGGLVAQSVVLTLSQQEALVLFEWLANFNEHGTSAFADQAEQRVLWNLEAGLESVLVAPLRRDYDKLLEQARAAVRDAVD